MRDAERRDCSQLVKQLVADTLKFFLACQCLDGRAAVSRFASLGADLPQGSRRVRGECLAERVIGAKKIQKLHCVFGWKRIFSVAHYGPP